MSPFLAMNAVFVVKNFPVFLNIKEFLIGVNFERGRFVNSSFRDLK